MKKLSIIWIVVLIVLVKNYSEELKLPPSKPNDKWFRLSDEEQYNILLSYATLAVEYRNQYFNVLEQYHSIQSLNNEKDDILYSYEKIIKKLNRKNKFGFGFDLYGGLTQELRADVFTSLNFYFYFLEGRVCFAPGGYVKIYDKLGGGLKVGFNFNF